MYHFLISLKPIQNFLSRLIRSIVSIWWKNHKCCHVPLPSSVLGDDGVSSLKPAMEGVFTRQKVENRKCCISEFLYFRDLFKFFYFYLFIFIFIFAFTSTPLSRTNCRSGNTRISGSLFLMLQQNPVFNTSPWIQEQQK